MPNFRSNLGFSNLPSRLYAATGIDDWTTCSPELQPLNVFMITGCENWSAWFQFMEALYQDLSISAFKLNRNNHSTNTWDCWWWSVFLDGSVSCSGKKALIALSPFFFFERLTQSYFGSSEYFTAIFLKKTNVNILQLCGVSCCWDFNVTTGSNPLFEINPRVGNHPFC